MVYSRALTAVTLLLLALSLTGCFSSNPADIKAFMIFGQTAR